MKKLLAFASLCLATGVIATSVWAGGTAKSGPQSGDRVPGPFHPLNVTGEFVGKKNCLFCSNGANPVAVVFARDLTPEVSKLITKLDEATTKNKSASMGSFAVFCSDKDGLEGALKTLATKSGIKTLVLSIDNPSGPDGYKIAKDAEVTVLLYNDFTVRANHAFKKGELNEKGIDEVVKDVAKIVK
ncbi:MAG: hypothetical protein U0793_12880 [Gemmataceae bacterium]